MAETGHPTRRSTNRKHTEGNITVKNLRYTEQFGSHGHFQEETLLK